MSEDGATWTTETLERIKLVVLTTISPELAAHFALPPRVEVSPFRGFIADDLAVRIIQEVYGKELERVSAEYPADWWQAFKARWFPAWAKQRWPVRMKQIELVAQELYPKVDKPEWEPVLHLSKLERQK